MGMLTGGTVSSLEDTKIPNLQRKINTMLLGIFFLLPCSLLKVSSVTGLNSLTKSGSAQILEEDNFPGSLIPQDPAV